MIDSAVIRGLIVYILDDLKGFDRDLVKQRRFNSLVTVFMLTTSIYIFTTDGQKKRIKRLEKEIGELKRTKGD